MRTMTRKIAALSGSLLLAGTRATASSAAQCALPARTCWR